MRNSSTAGASWEEMNTMRTGRTTSAIDRDSLSRREFPRRRPGLRSDPLEGAGPWIVFAIGVLLMLAAALVRGDEPVSASAARRTEKFTATLPARSTLRVVNVSGDIVATSGRAFSAVCTTTVTASTKERAEELLGQTRTVQTRDGDEVTLESRWPEMMSEESGRRPRAWGSSRFGNFRSSRCRDCRITMRYEVVVPPGVTAFLHTVNGEVRVQDVDGELDVQSVNGNVAVRGSRRGVRAQTVNGKVDVAAAGAPAGSILELKTVSGSVLLTLPKDAQFDLNATTMNGSIESTFPLPPRESREESSAWDESRHGKAPEASRAPKAPKAPKPPKAPKADPGDSDEDVDVDVPGLERELRESMKEVDVQVRESLREAEGELSRMKFPMPGGEYRGAIGQAGARVRLSTLNGKILLLAAGSKESDAKPLFARRSFVVTIPRVAVRAPEVRVRIPEVRVQAPRPPHVPSVRVSLPGDETVVRGDVAGDFLATAGGGSYQVGKVSGKVNILTHSGEIHVASAGAGAELKTFGGDILVGPVAGDFRAQTLAGDIRAGAVAGSATADTSGGDIRIDRIGGSADARTAGGDIVLSAVGGSVRAETGGGEVRIVVVSRDAKGGVTVRNTGGDVTLTLPANFHGELDLAASDADWDENAIRSEFPEVVVTRRSGSQHASGTLNGGGTRVAVRTSSGSIRIRRGPAAGS